MTEGKPRRPKKVRPIFLVAMGVALAGFGLLSGIALDLATRPDPVRPPPAVIETRGPRSFSPPQFLDSPRDLPIERPSGAPVRAWAPEVDKPTVAPPRIAFAVPSAAAPGRPVVAIVIDDMGVDRTRSLRMLELRGPLTVSLMTYAEGLPGLVARAREGGHEVMAHLPMEPLDAGENPGRGALRVNMDAAAIRSTLAADLDDWSGYVGINNHMGSKFTADRPRMDVVMAELKARGLLWLDSKTSAASTGTAAAEAAGVPFVERDVFIDNVQTEDAVLAQLAEAEKVARARGTAIAIGHPHDATLAALTRWLPGLPGRGIALVPLTEVLRRRSSGS